MQRRVERDPVRPWERRASTEQLLLDDPPARLTGKSGAASPSTSLLAITVNPATVNHDAAPCAITFWVRL
jgi:hypothetical protein